MRVKGKNCMTNPSAFCLRYFLFLIALLCVIEKSSLYSDDNLLTATSTSTSSKGSTIEPFVIPPPEQPKQKMPQKIPEKIEHIVVNFLLPGVVALQQGEWVGNDHLFGLSHNIGVVVEIVKPPGVVIPISETAIQAQVGQFLKAGHVNPRLQIVGSTPLPYLNIIIMLNPIENGYAAFIAVRLFEDVQIRRFHLKLGTTFQAITWERQEFIVFPTDQLKEQISKVLQSIVTTFNERVQTEPKI